MHTAQQCHVTLSCSETSLENVLPKMTYKVSSEMLNPSIVYHITQIVLLLSFTSDKYNYYYYYY